MAAASPTPIAETAPEVWRAVVGYETEYEVSSHGRVRRLRFRNGCTRFTLETPVLMKPGKRGGYLR